MNYLREFDITDDGEELDPLQKRFGQTNVSQTKMVSNEKQSAFCPYCGTKTEAGYVFCNKCGKKLPWCSLLLWQIRKNVVYY